MDIIYFAVLILILFNAKKSDECDNVDIFAMAGCNISLTWILPDTRRDILSFSIRSSYEKNIANLRGAQTNCEVGNISSVICNVYSSDDGLIVVLNLFNATEGQSGNYTFWKRTLFLEQSSNTSKQLVVIGKPTIMEVQKPILGLPFQMICNTTYEQEHYLYRWRINDIQSTAVYNGNTYTISSLGMNNNFNNVTCQVCFNETARNLSCVTCGNDGCSKYSDPYTIQVLYGPDNVSLSRGERHFYLKEHDIFSIDCFANCYPKCIFWWKGRDTIESQKLTIIFESRMTGQYACHVTNQQTNVTLVSDPIIVHDATE
ncbi:hypothetical protein ACJMK2_026178, partial [Sinanodonta woodiana]